MRVRKWMWLLPGGLVVIGIAGCSQPDPDRLVATEAVTQTVRATPSRTPSRQVDITKSPVPSAPPGQSPLATAVPISSTPTALKEESVAVNPTLPFPSDPAVQKLVVQAKDDLARRLDIPAGDVALLAVFRQRFPPDGFYCRPTKARAARDESPVVVSGESIILSAQGRKYEYHADQQSVVFCRELR